MSDSETPRRADDLGRLINLLESRALPLLERIALALERSPASLSADPGRNGTVEGRGLQGFRQAITEGQWSHAEAIARELSLERPGDPQIVALTEELQRARLFAIDDIRQRIEAARLANDPEGVLGSRDELAQILHGEAILEVDRPLVKWLLGLVQRRLRTGTVRPDVVALATRVAESFGGTTEGASLRASLPTLRRSAGLCPKCAEPYAGVGDACPKCLAASAAPTPLAIIPDEPEEADDPDAEFTGDPIDLNNERFWEVP